MGRPGMEAVSLWATPPVPSHAARIQTSRPRTEGKDGGRFRGHRILAREEKGEREGDRGRGTERGYYLTISDLVALMPQVATLPREATFVIQLASPQPPLSLLNTGNYPCCILDVIHNYEYNATLLICCKMKSDLLQTMQNVMESIKGLLGSRTAGHTAGE